MKNSISKVPVILQMEALECGAASLAMVLAYYKKYIPLEKLRVDCNVSRDGSTAKYILLAAKYHNLLAKGYKMGTEKIKQQNSFPMIIHWNFNHFVVLCGFDKKGNAVINDPASGRVKVSSDEFDKCFTGIVLTFEPSENFVQSGEKKSVMKFIMNSLKGLSLPMVFVITMGFILALLQSAKPIFYEVFTDKVMIGNDKNWLKSIILGMVIVLLIGFLVELLENRYLSRIKAKISITSSSGFMWHLLRLPVEFFSQRFTGDIVARQMSNNQIAFTLCTKIIPVSLNCIMILFYLILMVTYDPWMTSIGIIVAVIDITVIQLTAKKNANAARNQQRDLGKLSGMTSSCISMIETIKSSGAEYGFFEKIAGYQAKYNNSLLKVRSMNVYLGAIPSILSSLGECAVMLIGVYSIFSGRFTIGMLMAFQGFMGMFMQPVTSLVYSMQAYQEMNGSAERVNDVMNYAADVNIDLNNMDTSYEPLTGNVELEHINFAYSRMAPPVIYDFSVNVQKGNMVAFVGGSGSGKSTLAKLISGLYKPLKGSIRFDGRDISEINRYIFTNSLAVVDQSISLFEGTVRENISMWDETMEEETIVRACKDACIHDDIMSRKEGYEYLIKEGGSNFSGGQRQRLEIARAFAADPTILILDEATSALDPETEKIIMDAIKKRNITCFVIAHRLSTIRDADEIILLEYGKEIERGTHNSLMKLDGKYAQLVMNE